MQRRHFLTLLVGSAIASQAGWPGIGHAQTSSGQQATTAGPMTWRNWSGSQSSNPRYRLAPRSVNELLDILTDPAHQHASIRPVGSGHSFSPLVPTNDVLVSLARLNGVLDHDDEQCRARIATGTLLGQLGQPLEAINQALFNMPDIDQQSLGGLLATATHGTGAELMSLSGYIEGLTLVTAQGDVLECSRDQNPDIFQAARVGLGSLGFVTDVTLQNRRPYRLKKTTEWLPLEDILNNADARVKAHRNYEFFYIPFSGMGFTSTHDITDEPVSETDAIDQNDGARDLQQARDYLSWSPRLRRLILGGYMRTLSTEVKVAPSWQNYTSPRNVRFNEMEYHLSRDNWKAALREVIDTIETLFPEVFFPIEVRFVKADDVWLSPFYQRDSVSIAVHRFFEEGHTPLFEAVEPILKRYGGRPHWGKLNTLTGADFEALYPKWQAFSEVREALDPNGRFLNPYLARLFNQPTSTG
ncbi:D-arabinono-1,4-lactone oxidase [Marinobacter sp. MDS2]|uniref:D-arabinono-1,4-lactone oxidase n=1 Tax=Marinobacter sp. MDS2 TaxID=3065961 RepID=UPI00273CBE84|nr:D-arabinono-1,4-lactone oxidase [Marinobacter sp. MDS2]MDP4547934.1 D-arabinono-1,4-lactone oxidase [Marinobacter sp. MDS2]